MFIFPIPGQRKNTTNTGSSTPHFAETVHRALRREGVVYLRTDDRDYFEQMTGVFDANPGFEKVETPGELAELLDGFRAGISGARNQDTPRRVPTNVTPHGLHVEFVNRKSPIVNSSHINHRTVIVAGVFGRRRPPLDGDTRVAGQNIQRD